MAVRVVYHLWGLLDFLIHVLTRLRIGGAVEAYVPIIDGEGLPAP